MNETIHITGAIERETDRAILVAVNMLNVDPMGGGFVEFTRKAWLPKSKVNATDTGWTIPEWLAVDRGLQVWTNPGSRVGVTEVPA